MTTKLAYGPYICLHVFKSGALNLGKHSQNWRSVGTGNAATYRKVEAKGASNRIVSLITETSPWLYTSAYEPLADLW